jgi:hypothetical protein
MEAGIVIDASRHSTKAAPIPRDEKATERPNAMDEFGEWDGQLRDWKCQSEQNQTLQCSSVRPEAKFNEEPSSNKRRQIQFASHLNFTGSTTSQAVPGVKAGARDDRA